MGVVVDRFEVERGAELLLGIGESRRAVVRGASASRIEPFAGSHPAGPLERDHRGVRVAAGEESDAFLIPT